MNRRVRLTVRLGLGDYLLGQTDGSREVCRTARMTTRVASTTSKTIRKSLDECTSDILAHRGRRLRELANLLERATQLDKKLVAEGRILSLVPAQHRANVIFGLSAKNDLMGHWPRRRRAKTSSMELPDAGSASYSASLRSSSSRCQSVSGNDSGAAEMLSHITSTNRIRSLTGSSRISATRARFMFVSVPLSTGARPNVGGNRRAAPTLASKKA
jgi:hypothetical protein